MGPRGSGKSTWLRATYPDAHVIDLLSEETYQRLLAKSGKTFTDAWCRGLRAVSGLKGLRRRIIVYPQGPVLQTKDGIDVIPFKNFADRLADNTLWI